MTSDESEKAASEREDISISKGDNDQLNETRDVEGDVRQIPGWKDALPQILATSVCMSIVIQPGISLAFSGVLIPQLADNPLIEGFDKYKASWIASSVTIAQPVGSILVGPLMDWLGRKKTILLSCIPIIAGWIIMYLATTSLWPVYAGRILCGLGGGMTTVALVYTAEISHVHFRPMLLAFNSIAVALGIVLATVIGSYCHWQSASLFFCSLACLSLMSSAFLPESPHWLLNFSKTPEKIVKRHVRWINRSDWLFKEEWGRLQGSKSKTRYEDKKTEKKRSTLFKRASLMPFSVLLALFFLQQTSGTYVVIFYTVNIFQSIGIQFKQFDAYKATITLGLLRFVMSLVSAGLSKRIGRKPLMVVTSIGMSLTSFSAAILMRADQIRTIEFGAVNATIADSSTTSGNSLCILFALVTFVCFGALGHMVIPWTLMSELLPIQARATGSGVLVSYASLLLFLIIKTLPGLLDIVELPIVFIGYSVMSAASAVFVHFFLPETFRKTFQEIASHFDKN